MFLFCIVIIEPGVWLANPERPVMQSDAIRRAGWDIITAPVPTKVESK